MQTIGVVPHYTMLPRSSREYYRSISTSHAGSEAIPDVLDYPIDDPTLLDDDKEQSANSRDDNAVLDDVSETEALADFMAGFYGPFNPTDNEDRSKEDGFNAFVQGIYS